MNKVEFLKKLTSCSDNPESNCNNFLSNLLHHYTIVEIFYLLINKILKIDKDITILPSFSDGKTDLKLSNVCNLHEDFILNNSTITFEETIYNLEYYKNDTEMTVRVGTANAQ